jgi:hypothetical protein
LLNSRERTETSGGESQYGRPRSEALSSWAEAGCRYQLCQLAEVLGGCCEEELIARTIGSSQSKAVEREDALEVREEHLDLFAHGS